MRQAGFSAFFHEDVFDPFEMTTPKGGGADSAPLVSLTVSGRAVSSDTIIWVDGVDDFDATLPVDGAMMDGKGGTKGKPTDDGGTGGGGGGGGGGKGGGKPDKGGDTGGDTGGGTDGGTGGDTGGDPGGDPDGVLTTYTSGGDAATSYNVTIVFEGTWTVALQEDFIAAADYLSSIILGDQTDDTSAITGEFVDDVRITANLIEIDGTYGVLGRAGPQSVRTDTFLTVDGLMEFDIADAELFDGQGLWDDIVLHEMMHAIGFGTLWGYLGLTSGSVAGGDMIFTGDMATAAYNADFLGLSPGDLGYADGVPIETDGGSGTAGGHWDEELFANELLTGYINGSNYISTMTIAALEDMGYDTVLDDPNDPDDLFAADFIA